MSKPIAVEDPAALVARFARRRVRYPPGTIAKPRDLGLLLWRIRNFGPLGAPITQNDIMEAAAHCRMSPARLRELCAPEFSPYWERLEEKLELDVVDFALNGPPTPRPESTRWAPPGRRRLKRLAKRRVRREKMRRHGLPPSSLLKSRKPSRE